MPFVREQHFIPTPIKATHFLIRTLGFSPTLAQKTIDKARLRLVDNSPIHKSQLISGEVWLTRFVHDYYPESALIAPIFHTKDFALFDKPAKLLTHPKGTFTHASLIDSIRHFCGAQAQPIHRLDYETSGAILSSMSKKSEQALKSLIESRAIHKRYLAKVHGVLDRELIIDAPIYTPHRFSRGHLSIRSRIDSAGKAARTRIRPIALDSTKRFTFIHAQPLTGRTHQIRLHCAHIGHPICGDLLYGGDDELADLYLRSLRENLQSQHELAQLSQGIKQNLAHDLDSAFDSTNTLESSLDSGANPQNSAHKLLSQTLCLHAHSLHFCFQGIEYTLSTKLPAWWLPST